MIGSQPHLMKERGTNRRLTLLDCGICGALGPFTITAVRTDAGRRFVGPCCVAKMRVCPLCDLHDDDPDVRSCTRPGCPMKQKEAA